MNPLVSLPELLAPLPAAAAIVMHSAAAHPTRLARLLAEAAPALQGRTVHTLMPCGAVAYAQPPASELLDLCSFLPGPGLRPALDAGRLRPLRLAMSTIAQAFASGRLPVGAVLLRVAPPDADGFVNLGVAVDMMPAAIAAARVVVAEIDPAMPRVCGGARVPASRIDAFVDAVDGPHTAAPAAADETDSAIAGHVASLVEDGHVLQLGVGALPEQVLARLGHLKHLGLHTGIIGDGVRPLIERGVIDNSRKSAFAGISVATMALGSRDFQAFLDGNRAVELHACALTHGAATLRAIDRLCAINSALQVDLQGRVNAEWAGRRRVSLPGGLPDFARAASARPQGRSIVALRATSRSGDSNVLPLLDTQPASLEPDEVDFIVTEHGVAALRGCSAEQRRRALVAVAHPRHRDGLTAA